MVNTVPPATLDPISERHNKVNVYISIEHSAGPLAIHSPFLMPDPVYRGVERKATDLSGSGVSIHPGPENIICFKLVPTDGPIPCPPEVPILATHTHKHKDTQLNGSFQSGKILADSMTKRRQEKDEKE